MFCSCVIFVIVNKRKSHTQTHTKVFQNAHTCARARKGRSDSCTIGDVSLSILNGSPTFVISFGSQGNILVIRCVGAPCTSAVDTTIAYGHM